MSYSPKGRGFQIYSALGNQIYHWSHYAFGLFFIYLLVPRFMFNDVRGSWLDRTVANYLRMVLFVILSGYLLVVLKLFELIGIIGAVVLWIMLRQSKHSARTQGGSYLIALLFDFAEFPRTIVNYVRGIRQRIKGSIFKLVRSVRQTRSTYVWVLGTLVGLVIVISIVMRLYVAITNPTPKMSDGDYLLAWTKYIDLRYLMHDGIYPQGFFFYMAVLGKFAVINPLYVVNFTGPLDSVMTILMMYYAVKTLTKSRTAGLVSITLYGILGHGLLLGEWIRQSGSETQEYGFVFVFPTMLFLHRYLEEQRQSDFWVAVAGLCDAGLVHPIAYALAVLGCCAVLITHCLTRFKDIAGKLPILLAAGTASGLIALLPFGLAIFYQLHAAQMNQNFVTAKVSLPVPQVGETRAMIILHAFLSLLPPLSAWDGVTLGAIVYLMTLSIVGMLRGRPNRVWMIAAVWGISCFMIYEFGPAITLSYLLSTRMIDIWAITQAAVVGVGVAAFIQQSKILQRVIWIEWSGALLFVALALISAPPRPIIPYDVQWPGDVNAYLEINNQYKYSGYMIVSPDFEYALVLGTGYHMLVSQFVNQFNPKSVPLTLRGQRQVDRNLAPYVFLYEYKRIFEVPKTMGIYSIYLPEYKNEIKANEQLKVWVKQFTAAHPRQISVFFNSRNLIVFKIPVDLRAKGTK